MNAAARRDYWLLTGISAAISLGALIFYYHQGAILLYGDSVAHINIARRVFDSQSPSLLQLGTVWLPLPHLLDIPFIVNDRMWQTGIGASIPSMLAYIAGTLGVFRLVSGLTPRGLASRMAGWIGALVYALNPNLIYMQATAMTESLYLAFFIWSAVYFAEFARGAREEPERARKALKKCALLVSAAMLVRFDGWFLAGVIFGGALIVLWRLKAAQRSPAPAQQMRSALLFFALLTGATGGLFLAYNQLVFGNALAFANGPYSPRAIQERSKTATMPTYPGEDSPRVAALQFLKISRLNLAEGRTEDLLFIASLLALLAAIYFARRFLPWTVLWMPIPFYVLSVAWGSVPIYQPEWWPFTYYNVRYGLQLLPAIAVFFALSYEFAGKFLPRHVVAVAALAIIAVSCFSVWKSTPICLREAQANGQQRLELELALAAELKKLPPSATLVIDCGAHPGAVQLAGIHLKRVLKESNPLYWTTALGRPAESADYVVAFPGDAVSRLVHLYPERLQPIATVGTPAQPGAIIYRTLR